MAENIRLFDLAPSPNNIKVRIALAYKGIPYERVPVDPMNRSTVVEISGQPLTPVLQHDDVVIFDSSAILRYLEVNVMREPRLFSAERDTMKAIEAWELRARTTFVEPVGLIFGQFFAPKVDPAAIERAGDLLADRADELERALEGRRFLVDERLTAADCSIAPLVWYGCLEEADLERMSGSPIPGFFHQHLRLDQRFERVREYAHRVLGLDA